MISQNPRDEIFWEESSQFSVLNNKCHFYNKACSHHLEALVLSFCPWFFFLILVGGESTFNSLFSKQEVTVSSLKGFVKPELLPVAVIIWMLAVLELISSSTSAKWQSVVQTPREFDIFNLLPCCDLDQERNKCLGLEKRVCS